MILDPSLLEGLSPEEREEAIQAAAAAQRAEERAEQRALERAMAQRMKERMANDNGSSSNNNNNNQSSLSSTTTTATATTNPQIKFVSKRQRLTQSVESETEKNETRTSTSATRTTTTTPTTSNQSTSIQQSNTSERSKYLSDKERLIIRQTYLGKEVALQDQELLQQQEQQQSSSSSKRKKKNDSTFNKKMTFRFQWDDTDDTLDQSDPLYSSAVLHSTMAHPQKRNHHRDPLDRSTDIHYNNNGRNGSNGGPNGRSMNNNNNLGRHMEWTVHTKPLEQMTTRDWRIYRENYEIVVKGGRAPPPLRNFREAKLHPALLQSIETVLRYTEPTPIQRQSIPIGLERRDLIGIAETGSGKVSCLSCAFRGCF